jgi:hypothetical protein
VRGGGSGLGFVSTGVVGGAAGASNGAVVVGVSVVVVVVVALVGGSLTNQTIVMIKRRIVTSVAPAPIARTTVVDEVRLTNAESSPNGVVTRLIS